MKTVTELRYIPGTGRMRAFTVVIHSDESDKRSYRIAHGQLWGRTVEKFVASYGTNMSILSCLAKETWYHSFHKKVVKDKLGNWRSRAINDGFTGVMNINHK